MVEVLVSIVVLSFGLLGVVGLQAMSLQANREARLQSVAGNLARELGELTRGNAAVALSATNNPYLVNAVSPLAAATQSNCLQTAGCADATATAASQMTDWLARVDQQLPDARVVVCFDTAPFNGSGDAVWACNGTAANGLLTVKLGWSSTPLNRGTANASVSLASASDSVPQMVQMISVEKRT